jgi:Icc-related predicted phosphoesterase
LQAFELMASRSIRIAAVGDIHCTRSSQAALEALFARIMNEHADVLLLAGDLTDHGHPDEAQAFARAVSSLRIPSVAVLGNHDYHSEQVAVVSRILTEAGIAVLDGETYEVQGVGIAGVKGFPGGFGPRALSAWGEPLIKAFVHEAINESLKLETALARLTTPSKVALLHYAPIEQTVVGEPLEIYPFVGSSRLEEPIGRFPVTLVVHGHAHRGRPDGVTSMGVPVFNVSGPLLARADPGRGFRLINVPVDEGRNENEGATDDTRQTPRT